MIKTINLRRFQIHKELDINLGLGVTTIIGPSDIGKSSVIRAIKWVVNNRPAGNDFIQGKGPTSIKVITTEGEIVRRKGRGKNLYKLGKKTFRAFGNDVPPEISKILGMTNINFQGQYDSPFWLSNTAGEVSRQLNQIVNLGVIDTTLSNLSSTVRKTNTESEIISSRLEEARENREKMKFAQVMDTSLKGVENLYSIWIKKSQECSVLERLYEGVSLHRDISKKATAAHLCGFLAVKKSISWETLVRRQKSLQELIATINQFSEIINRPIPDTKPIEQLGRAWSAIQRNRRTLHQDINEIKELHNNLERVKKELTIKRKDFKKRMGKVCPLCQRKMPS